MLHFPAQRYVLICPLCKGETFSPLFSQLGLRVLPGFLLIQIIDLSYNKLFFVGREKCLNFFFSLSRERDARLIHPFCFRSSLISRTPAHFIDKLCL